MGGAVVDCHNCAVMGEDVCVATLYRYMVDVAIQAGYSTVQHLMARDGVKPLNNLIQK
jgi:hypothetical protein